MRATGLGSGRRRWSLYCLHWRAVRWPLGGEGRGGQASRHATETQEGAAAEVQTAAGALPSELRCLQEVCARVSGCVPSIVLDRGQHVRRMQGQHVCRVSVDHAAAPIRPCFPRPSRLRIHCRPLDQTNTFLMLLSPSAQHHHDHADTI